jgi:hypothetical protein
MAMVIAISYVFYNHQFGWSCRPLSESGTIFYIVHIKFELTPATDVKPKFAHHPESKRGSSFIA